MTKSYIYFLEALHAQRQWWFAYKKTRYCERCGESHPACLQFHHRDPTQKAFELSKVTYKTYSRERIMAEVAKCDVLCANCHAIEHSDDRYDETEVFMPLVRAQEIARKLVGENA